MNTLKTVNFLRKTVSKDCFCLIDIDGSITTIEKCPTLEDFHNLIECASVETVTLEYPNLVMAVDDFALWLKPTNELATRLVDHFWDGKHINVAQNLGIPGKVIIFNDDSFPE